MKITAIRNSSNEKLTSLELERVASRLLDRLTMAGYKTGVEVKNSTCIKVGLHMSSFRIDVAVHGYNARFGRYVKSPKGYKRTDTPTWDQRVDFNNKVNAFLDSFGIVCRVKSGCYTIRDKERSYTESDWEDQTPTWMGYHGDQHNGLGELCSKIMQEDDAREELDSDRLESEHKASTREGRLASARASRFRMKTFESCTRVVIQGLQGRYSGQRYFPATKNGKSVSRDVFYKLLSKLSKWESKEVKKKSIDATIQALNPQNLILLQGGVA